MDAQNKTALVVDDDRMTARAVHDALLLGRGFTEVVVIHTLEEYTSLLERKPCIFDLVMSDLQLGWKTELGEMDGTHVLYRYWAQLPGNERGTARLLLMSGADKQLLREKWEACTNFGLKVEVLQKPFGLNDLGDILTKWGLL